MRLYHGKYIIPGLAVFFVIVTFPMWYGAATGKPAFENTIVPADGEHCVESKEFMRANHMQLLNDWRDEVVREGKRVYTAERDGREWNKSLTKTCMACHGKAKMEGENVVSATAATYCQHCHDYVGVNTYCWDCHIDPVRVGKEAK